MILGIGMDIVKTSRIERSVIRYGDRFLSRVFTRIEKEYCFGKSSPWESLAVRFAAKEAVFKALGRGWPDCGGYCSVEVHRDDNGRPEIVLHGNASRIADDLGVRRFFLTLTHDGGFAAATVVMEG